MLSGRALAETFGADALADAFGASRRALPSGVEGVASPADPRLAFVLTERRTGAVPAGVPAAGASSFVRKRLTGRGDAPVAAVSLALRSRSGAGAPACAGVTVASVVVVPAGAASPAGEASPSRDVPAGTRWRGLAGPAASGASGRSRAGAGSPSSVAATAISGSAISGSGATRGMAGAARGGTAPAAERSRSSKAASWVSGVRSTRRAPSSSTHLPGSRPSSPRTEKVVRPARPSSRSRAIQGASSRVETRSTGACSPRTRPSSRRSAVTTTSSRGASPTICATARDTTAPSEGTVDASSSFQERVMASTRRIASRSAFTRWR